MKITEIIIAILALILFTLHFIFEEFVFAVVMFFVAYSMFYFFASIPIIFNKKGNDVFSEAKVNDKKVKYIVFAIASGFSIASGLVSISFKLLKWPGYNSMFYMSLFLMSILLALSIIYFIKTKKMFFKRVIYRMIIFIIVIGYFLFLS